LLRDLSSTKKEGGADSDVESRIRAEVVGKITQKLMQLAGGDGATLPSADQLVKNAADQSQKKENGVVVESGQQETQPSAPKEATSAPWLESDECTSCDECININSKIFAYNDEKQAYIKDPNAGPYQDLVIAAEKCTAQVIHPGLPADPNAKDMEKWIKRGEKFN
jgi:pyruvate-ferredoxin/flavodoxin oxidoreductase